MISRAHMRRQLRGKGGITNVTPRTNYFLGGIKDRIRKLIPNEIANVAVKAAPFVAPFNPAVGALMRGIGRFDQRGSISDALKQGVATFGFGAGARKLGGAEDVFGGGLRDFSSPLSEKRTQAIKGLFEKQKVDSSKAKKDTSGILPKKVVEATTGKIPGVKELPKIVQEQLLTGGITAGASLLASYFQGDFREQKPGETMEDYLAARRETVGQQMRTYMDSYFKFDPEYSALDDAGRNAFVARYNVKDGGRIGYQTGGISSANTLAENIRRNRAAQAAFQQSIAPAQERVREQIRKRTPVQEYAMGEDSILGPLSKKAASTIMAGQDRSQAALDVLNQTMAPTTDTGIMTQAPTTDAAQISGAMNSLINVNKQPTQKFRPGFENRRIDTGPSRGELLTNIIPNLDKFGNYTGDDPLLKDYAAAGRGTASAMLTKLPANHPYADSGAGYYAFNGTVFTRVADENPTPEYMKFLRSQYLPSLAKGGMPTGIMRTNKAGVMERDYRDKGGFVPVGIKEKADDVPAMLSKNEFVMTANAVRGAGNGSIEKGAQRMYDTMKRLEKRAR